MDLRGFAFPPLTIAAVIAVLCAFDVFNSVSLESTPSLNKAHVTQPAVPASIMRRNADTLPATQNKIERIQSTQIQPVLTARLAASATNSALEQSTAAINDHALTATGIAGPSNAPQTDDGDENLAEVTNVSFAENDEPLIAATPSMATQATPVEMSDDGQVDLETVDKNS